MTAYESAMKSWIAETTADFPDAKDMLYNLRSMFGKVNERTLYSIGKIVASAISYFHGNGATNKEYDIYPIRYGNGIVRLIDRNSGKELSFAKMYNGLWSWKGPHYLVEINGGRQLGSTFWQNLEDDNFFKNAYRKK